MLSVRWYFVVLASSFLPSSFYLNFSWFGCGIFKFTFFAWNLSLSVLCWLFLSLFVMITFAGDEFTQHMHKLSLYKMHRMQCQYSTRNQMKNDCMHFNSMHNINHSANTSEEKNRTNETMAKRRWKYIPELVERKWEYHGWFWKRKRKPMKPTTLQQHVR